MSFSRAYARFPILALERLRAHRRREREFESRRGRKYLT
jgi:hypothetical protein